MDQHFEAHIEFEGKITKFKLTSLVDEVQSHPARGTFYELDQLVLHRSLIPTEGLTVVDIGANIGNHALFYSIHTNAQKIFCFEPNPIARELLQLNVELNSDTKIDLSYAHYGCGERQKKLIVTQIPGNLGAAKLEEPQDNSDDALVAVWPLDSILYEEPISFIKIDVEGMEIDVLRGATKILHRYRPGIAVEVMNQNVDQFWKWAEENSYHVLHAFRLYWDTVNYICIAKSGPTDTAKVRGGIDRFWEAEVGRRRSLYKP